MHLPCTPTRRPSFLATVWLLSGALALTAASAAAGTPDPEAIEFFEREVRPLLSSACFQCHGEKKQWAGLRLDSRESILKGGDSGPAAIPGNPNESLLLQAIKRTGDIQMPPEDELSERQIASLGKWIELGMPWPNAPGSNDAASAESHWAFQPVVKPAVPSDLDADHPADAFVWSKLLQAGLKSSPIADRRTLIRRATFDLTGLPPSTEEVEAFVQDDDPSAYEKLIDRLLASPHYGEQWGRHWLDVARYSDTKGYVYAREERFWVHAWAYRDWVVKALNDDMPYDRFLLLQLAADQEADDPASLAAMGFLTIGRRFLGVTHDIIDDRIDVVTRGTMGLTVGCARCHDHKYDPIPIQDYYSMYGIFQSCAEDVVPLRAGDEAFEKELAKRRQELAKATAAARKETADRVRARIADYLYAQFELEKYPEEGFDQILSKDDVAPAFVRRWQAYLAETAANGDPVFAAWHEYLDCDPAEFASHAEVVTQSLKNRPASELNPLVAEAFQTPPTSRRELADRYGELFAKVNRLWLESLEHAQKTGAPPPTALKLPAAEAIRKMLYGADAVCEVPDEPIVHTEMYFDSGTCVQLWKLQSEVDRLLINSPAPPPHAVILVDRPNPVTPRVFKRGDPRNKGDYVPRRFLTLLAGPDPTPFANGSGRLELAEAIISPDNPLTTRVIVNRVWMHHFGQGLVRTPSDFGTRADAPSHPELLDWLAATFVEEGWSLKKLHRLIMLSHTYRQTSHGPSDIAERNRAQQLDPENRLIWRMNVRRHRFEEMHDSLLAATSELNRSIGGKPQDMFAAGFNRRAVYGLIDRQFFPSTLRIFDFASPDLHIAQRNDTTVPQRALYFLNDVFLIERARRLAAACESESNEERVRRMFQACYQRDPTPGQLEAALSLIEASNQDQASPAPPTVAAWKYGYGRYDETIERIVGFVPLPFATERSWQGGPNWPDAKLGWVQLTAEGGHAGNDRAHAAVRRWVAPRDLTVQVRSLLVHDATPGDGVRGILAISRYGVQKIVEIHNRQQRIDLDDVVLKAGDSIDFAVDLGKGLNNDQFTWEVEITASAGDDTSTPTSWNSKSDFRAKDVEPLDPWEQLAQVLLAANEFVFVD